MITVTILITQTLAAAIQFLFLSFRVNALRQVCTRKAVCLVFACWSKIKSVICIPIEFNTVVWTTMFPKQYSK